MTENEIDQPQQASPPEIDPREFVKDFKSIITTGKDSSNKAVGNERAQANIEIFDKISAGAKNRKLTPEEFITEYVKYNPEITKAMRFKGMKFGTDTPPTAEPVKTGGGSWMDYPRSLAAGAVEGVANVAGSYGKAMNRIGETINKGYDLIGKIPVAGPVLEKAYKAGTPWLSIPAAAATSEHFQKPIAAAANKVEDASKAIDIPKENKSLGTEIAHDVGKAIPTVAAVAAGQAVGVPAPVSMTAMGGMEGLAQGWKEGAIGAAEGLAMAKILKFAQSLPLKTKHLLLNSPALAGVVEDITADKKPEEIRENFIRNVATMEILSAADISRFKRMASSPASAVKKTVDYIKSKGKDFSVAEFLSEGPASTKAPEKTKGVSAEDFYKDPAPLPDRPIDPKVAASALYNETFPETKAPASPKPVAEMAPAAKAAKIDDLAGQLDRMPRAISVDRFQEQVKAIIPDADFSSADALKKQLQAARPAATAVPPTAPPPGAASTPIESYRPNDMQLPGTGIGGYKPAPKPVAIGETGYTRPEPLKEPEPARRFPEPNKETGATLSAEAQAAIRAKAEKDAAIRSKVATAVSETAPLPTGPGASLDEWFNREQVNKNLAHLEERPAYPASESAKTLEPIAEYDRLNAEAEAKRIEAEKAGRNTEKRKPFKSAAESVDVLMRGVRKPEMAPPTELPPTAPPPTAEATANPTLEQFIQMAAKHRKTTPDKFNAAQLAEIERVYKANFTGHNPAAEPATPQAPPPTSPSGGASATEPPVATGATSTRGRESSPKKRSPQELVQHAKTLGRDFSLVEGTWSMDEVKTVAKELGITQKDVAGKSKYDYILAIQDKVSKETKPAARSKSEALKIYAEEAKQLWKRELTPETEKTYVDLRVSGKTGDQAIEAIKEARRKKAEAPANPTKKLAPPIAKKAVEQPEASGEQPISPWLDKNIATVEQAITKFSKPVSVKALDASGNTVISGEFHPDTDGSFESWISQFKKLGSVDHLMVKGENFNINSKAPKATSRPPQ